MSGRRQMLNEPEELTLEELQAGLEQYCIRVYAKPRLLDALETMPGFDARSLSKIERDYAFTSHLDFFAQDTKRGSAFAVEFDGATHWTDANVMARDALKNKICEANRLPLLRIDGSFFKRVGPYRKNEGQWSLIRWLAEVWALEQAFYEAQESGHIPEDEPFMYFAFFDPETPFKPTHDPFHICHFIIKKWHGSLQRWGPVRDEHGNALGVAVVTADDGKQILGVGRCRPFWFASINGYDLAYDLALSDAAWKYRSYSQGRTNADDPAVIARWLKEVEQAKRPY